MTRTPERADWINTFVGLLDNSFHLTDEEQFGVATVVRGLLDALKIPSRSIPTELPVAVVQEMHSGLYTQQLNAPRLNGQVRPVRAADSTDHIASIEAWRTAFETMILTAYPDLALEERLLMSTALTDLFAALGVPGRAAATFPDAVVIAHRRIENDA